MGHAFLNYYCSWKISYSVLLLSALPFYCAHGRCLGVVRCNLQHYLVRNQFFYVHCGLYWGSYFLFRDYLSPSDIMGNYPHLVILGTGLAFGFLVVRCVCVFIYCLYLFIYFFNFSSFGCNVFDGLRGAISLTSWSRNSIYLFMLRRCCLTWVAGLLSCSK